MGPSLELWHLGHFIVRVLNHAMRRRNLIARWVYSPYLVSVTMQKWTSMLFKKNSIEQFRGFVYHTGKNVCILYLGMNHPNKMEEKLSQHITITRLASLQYRLSCYNMNIWLSDSQAWILLLMLISWFYLYFSGTLFLWMFWPSFNSVYLLQRDIDESVALNVICSTYLSMAVSAVTAIAISVLSNPRGKINMVRLSQLSH